MNRRGAVKSQSHTHQRDVLEGGSTVALAQPAVWQCEIAGVYDLAKMILRWLARRSGGCFVGHGKRYHQRPEAVLLDYTGS